MNSYTGKVGGEGVGGLFDDDDLIRFCGGCVESFAVVEDVVSAVEEVVAAVDGVAPEEITGAKMRVSRGGSSGLLSAKWMKSALQNSKGHVVPAPLIGELLSEQVASSPRCCRSKVC